MSRLRSWIIVGVIALAVAIVIGVYKYTTGTIPVRAAAVTESDIRQFIDERAETTLSRMHEITTPADGRIAATDLEPGDTVEKGQVVAQFVYADLQIARRRADAEIARIEAEIRKAKDDSVEQITLQQAVAMVASVNDMVQAAAARVISGKKRYETAVRSRQRIETLFRTGARSAEELDDAQLEEVTAGVDYDTDQLVLSSMRAIQTLFNLMPTLIRRQVDRKELDVAVLEQQLAEAQAARDKLSLEAERADMQSPVDGVVLTRAYTNERPLPAGTVLMTIGQIDQLEVEADILSQDAVRIQPGDPVDIFGPALGGHVARGSVVRVEPFGFTKRSSLGVEQQRVTVQIAFASRGQATSFSQGRLGVGYRLRVRIITDQKSAALVVPRTALLRSSDGTWQVFSVREGQAQLTQVEVGLMNDDWVEIAKPLKVGESVIVAPESTLTDGARVRIQQSPN